MTQKFVYLDNNATTPLHPEVKQKIIEFLDYYGNPSSMHTVGRKVKQQVQVSRQTIADFINALPEEIMFTSGGTEADNIVLNTIFHKDLVGKGLIVSTIEHPAILTTAKNLQERGVDLHIVDVDEFGKVKLEQLEQLLKSNKIGLVSIMMVNNEIGTIQDIETIASLAHKYDALFHTDAVQAVGKIPVDVKDLDIDYLTLSGHKNYGPKGIGALYAKTKAPLLPLTYGGHQENARRPGTENTIGIIGLGAAIDMRAKEMADEELRLEKLKVKLKQGLESKIPDIHFNGHQTESVANTVNVSFAGAEGEAILLYLDLEGIAVSTGSACASGSLDPSHVLLATGLPIEYAHGSVRMSMGRETTEQDIDYVLDIVPKVIKRVRDMSTIYRSSK